jgi:superfamily II DNA/RNA helicase
LKSPSRAAHGGLETEIPVSTPARPGAGAPEQPRAHDAPGAANPSAPAVGAPATTTTGDDAPGFASLGVPDWLVRGLARRGITTAFPIQAAAMPDALAGRDVCGRAPTGSGKTIAFGVPLVMRAQRSGPRRPRGLVLVPTRELAAQVATELEHLAGERGPRVQTFYGGVGFGPQISALRRGVDIAVACPGRLADLIGQGAISLADVSVAVIDEADRMADMGFLPEVRRLLDQCPGDRQTLLFSATLDGDVDVLTTRYQRDPARHEPPHPEDHHQAEHRYWRVSRADRVVTTAALIDRVGPTVVFCRTRHGADRLARQLGVAGVEAAAIHGGRSQAQRDRALQAFHRGTVAALVATDVAARGIHVDDVACVVHFDPPADEKDYVHRSGRTARAGTTGLVVSMVGKEVDRQVAALQRQLGHPVGTEVPDHDDLPPAPVRRRRGRDDGEARLETGHAPSNRAGSAPRSNRSKRGPASTNGPASTDSYGPKRSNGSEGANGAKRSNGSKGANGANGRKGANGPKPPAGGGGGSSHGSGRPSGGSSGRPSGPSSQPKSGHPKSGRPKSSRPKTGRPSGPARPGGSRRSVSGGRPRAAGGARPTR